MALTEQDRLHLARALELAELGRGNVSPNPMVGCVIAPRRGDDRRGLARRAGRPPRGARRAGRRRPRGNDPAGADVFVTLEPCAHTGTQPPCADALVEARVARVVYAADDPSEKASGQGPGDPPRRRHRGRAARRRRGRGGAAPEPGVPEARANGRPLVTLKSARHARRAYRDRVRATRAGSPARRAARSSTGWRAEADAVAIGIGTALADDPLLTARDSTRRRAASRFASCSTRPPGCP